jgi:hypothetical protein
MVRKGVGPLEVGAGQRLAATRGTAGDTVGRRRMVCRLKTTSSQGRARQRRTYALSDKKWNSQAIPVRIAIKRGEEQRNTALSGVLKVGI